MKLVEAIIKPAVLDEVKSALLDMGIDDVMESELIIHGRGKAGKSTSHLISQILILYLSATSLRLSRCFLSSVEFCIIRATPGFLPVTAP